MTVSIDYTALQQTANSLISALGNKYTLIRPSSNGSDTVIATNVPGTFDTRITSFFNSTSGGPVASGLNTLYVPFLGANIAPQFGDRMTQGAMGWRVTKVDFIQPDNLTTILYTLSLE